MTFQYVLDTMTRAGLTPTEMIKLMPVGRATFYNWKRGQPITDLLRFRLTIARCKVIEAAVESGRLPLSEDIERRQRMLAIDKALKETHKR